jgi:acyl-CoA thioesterase I
MSILRSTLRSLAFLTGSLLMSGCGAAERNEAAQDTAPPPPSASPAAGGTSAATAAAPTILFLGTSLTAGFGLPGEQAYPARIQEKIDSAGLPFRVVNAGVSGETSAGALRRVDWLLRQPFEVLVLETGANDMLRGADLDSTRANIQAIVDRVRQERPGVRIVLVGMMAPPNLGRDYATRFQRMYPEVAERNELALVPFLLEDVGGVSALNLADGIHPNAEGQGILARTVWRVLEPELRAMAGEAG